ncbi:hypothetical protein Bbelb_139070 [Branchiostoma belcheri]|nr:hypothetical protein Bbelb_139070 [Branchiostoma belcheri]
MSPRPAGRCEDPAKENIYNEEVATGKASDQKLSGWDVLPDAQTSLQQAGYYPGPFPENTDIKDALSRLLENVAFFGDILLRFPDMTHDVLKKHQEWRTILEAAVVFCNQTQLYSEGVNHEQLNLVRCTGTADVTGS